MTKFQIIDHTADIGIKVIGTTMKELFENAAYGMFSLMTEIDKIVPKQKLNISVTGNDYESLLVNWLNDLLYASFTQKLLFCQFDIDIQNKTLSGVVSGDKIDHHKVILEIKAATYHQLKIDTTHETYYTTQIIFDV